MGKGDTALSDILALCDKLRDIDLVPLGVALDDQEGKVQRSTHGSSLRFLDRWQSSCETSSSDGVN
jgi:hypothetical protein